MVWQPPEKKRKLGQLTAGFYGFIPELKEFPRERWGQPCFAMLGSYNGPVDQAEEAFRPLRTNAEPIADFSGARRYVDLQAVLEADYPEDLSDYWKAAYLSELTDPALDLVIRRGGESLSGLSTIDDW